MGNTHVSEYLVPTSDYATWVEITTKTRQNKRGRITRERYRHMSDLTEREQEIACQLDCYETTLLRLTDHYGVRSGRIINGFDTLEDVEAWYRSYCLGEEATG